MLKKDYCILENTSWEACHVCGKPLKQHGQYPYLHSSYADNTVTNINFGHNPKIPLGVSTSVCCSDSCIEMAYFSYC